MPQARFTRRQLTAFAGMFAAGTEFSLAQSALAQSAQSPGRNGMPPGAVKINANENPLGPCAEASEAIHNVIRLGGRYLYENSFDMSATLAEIEGLNPEYVMAFAGSSDSLHRAVLAFTSPTRSFIVADPGYEAGAHAARLSGARVIRVRLTTEYAHDVRAMAAADLRAGAAMARPDLLNQLKPWAAGALPITGMAGATTSLKIRNLAADRRKTMRDIRDDTFSFLTRHGISFIPSDSNCFMLDARRPGGEFVAAMAKQNVYVGRVWSALPNHSRISVGTADEMAKFKQAVKKVLT